MNISSILKSAQLFTDEQLESTNLLSFANSAIARINTECGTLFPFYENLTSEYKSFPINWQFDLIRTYAAYAIKMNDGTLSEADRYLDEFYKTLERFKDNLGILIKNYEDGNTENGISSDYINKEGFGNIFKIDTENAINKAWFSDGSGGTL